MSGSDNAPYLAAGERRRRAKEKLLFASASVLLMKRLIGRTAWLKLISGDVPGGSRSPSDREPGMSGPDGATS